MASSSSTETQREASGTKRDQGHSDEVLSELSQFFPVGAARKVDRQDLKLDLSHFESFDQIKSFLCDRSTSGDLGKQVSVAFVELLLKDFGSHDRQMSRQISGLLVYLGTHRDPAVAELVPRLVQNIGLDSSITNYLPALLAHKFGQELIQESLDSMSPEQLKNFVGRLCRDKAVVSILQIARSITPELLGRVIGGLESSTCAAIVGIAARHAEYRPILIKIIKADALVNGDERTDRWINGLIVSLGGLQSQLSVEQERVAELEEDYHEVARALSIRALPETDLMLGLVRQDPGDEEYECGDPFYHDNRLRTVNLSSIELLNALNDCFPAGVAQAIFEATPDWDNLPKN